MDFARGNYIDNRWLKPTSGTTIRSINPATQDEVVLEAPTSAAHATEAVAAAARAWPAWAGLALDDRIAALRRFGRELTSRTEALARAITQEMGKTIREARQEATGLVARVDMVIDQQLPQVKTWAPPGIAGECRYHPLGVIGVLGPFNFPLHLCHAHIIPALATGNTVVVKPSERTPLAFQRYMEAWDAANLPPILHMVQGGADVGRAILGARELRGVAFTGSWRVGHQITKSLVDRPEVLAALEMGGQNMCIVLEDADLDQALEGILLGGFLTTGQRCTCTARVLVQRSIAGPFIERLVKAARNLTFGDPMSDVFMGPMASVGDRDRVEALCRAGREAGAEALLAAELRDGGAWRGPSVHLIAPDHDSDYTREEVFGPDLAVTIVDDLDHALAVVKGSPYGLSVGLFSSRRQAFEQVYLQTSVGCVSWNRSTNRTLGALPFGGVGKSGNHRPAGSDAVRYTTYPVQVLWNDPGVLENDPYVRQATSAADPLMAIEAMHRVEEALEPYGIHPDIDPSGRSGVVKLPLAQLDLGGVVLSRPLVDHLKQRAIAAEVAEQAVRIPLPFGNEAPRILARALADALHALRPLHLARFLGRRPASERAPNAADGKPSLPRSAALVRRLVGGDLAPDDDRPPVIDPYRSSGAYLASVDDDPIVFTDAASQRAVHAAGLNPPAVLEALVAGRFGSLPLDGGSAEGHPHVATLTAGLREAIGHTHPFVRLSGSGTEANELALAVCATRRPGRRAIVAFRGASHGRTMLALHATWDPDERLGSELGGHGARWIDLPVWREGGAGTAGGAARGPQDPDGWLELWRMSPDARAALRFAGDALLDAEVRALEALEVALADDQVAAVVIGPEQAAAGERRATPRFFRALRLVTERSGVPLVMDEALCASHRGGSLFRHMAFDLPSPPDVVTSALEGQVGVTLSRWPIPVRAEVSGASALRAAVCAEPWRGSEGDGRPAEAQADLASAWPPAPPRLPAGTSGSYRLVRVGPAEWPSVRGSYEALQRLGDEPARHDDFDAFTALVGEPDTLAFAIFWTGPQKPGPAAAQAGASAIVKQGTLVAGCIGVALEHVGWLDGPRQDPSLGRGETLYLADVTVAAEHRGQGLGRALEEALIAAAITQRRPDGGPRFVFLTARGRAGGAGSARALAATYGGWLVARHGGDPGADYCRVPLTFPRLPPSAQVQPWPGGHAPAVLDLETGLERRLGSPQGLRPGNEELRQHLAEGRLNGAIVNKLSPCDVITPAVVRAHEWLRLQAPKRMKHLVLASGRCEALDDTLRAFKRQRPKARTALALGPVRAGLATAAARGVTLAGGDDMNWFGWPTLTDPTRDPERALLDLKRLIAERGADDVLAIVVEPVYHATGRAVPEGLWGALRAAADEHGLPILLVENTTAGYRTGKSFWRADTLPVPVDAVVWYPGGQLGLGFVADRYRVADKLGLLATWDGDELSLTRLVWELRIARTLPVAQRAAELKKALAPLGEVSGEGLFMTIETSNAEAIARRLAERGVRVGIEERILRVAPPLNLTAEDVARVAAVVREVAS